MPCTDLYADALDRLELDVENAALQKRLHEILDNDPFALENSDKPVQNWFKKYHRAELEKSKVAKRTKQQKVKAARAKLEAALTPEELKLLDL